MIVASIFAPRYVKWAGCDYDALLRLLDASCRRLGLRHVVISDAQRPGLDTAIFDLPQELMPMLLDGQRQFLAATPGPVLLVGADCLVTRDPRPYLAGDMTVTIGPFSDCPMNTGAIWCADGPTCAPVWRVALDLAPVEWGDDQRALYAAVKDARGAGLIAREVRCEEHNWAPDHVGQPCAATVVHFRGQRKAWMVEWARVHMGLVAA